LIAAAWQKSDSSRTIFHHGSKPQSLPAFSTPENIFLNLEDIWQLEPSAETFGKLIAETSAAMVEERSTTYIVSFDNGRTIGASQLLQATLTLSKSDLHPIEQTLRVQRGDELREYRFIEASFELLPLKSVAPTVFEIEPELTGGAGEPGRPGDWALRDLTAGRVPPPLGTSTPPPASAELEVDVAYLLNQAKADRNEQVTLTRSAGGSLRVEGVVDTRQRKNEFLKALAPVSNNPAVSIEIRTVEDSIQRPFAAGSVSVHEAEETANTIAADDDLRAYFQARNPSGPTDETIRNYSSQVVNRAYHALFHAIELNRLVSRFAGVDMRTVAPDARAKWLAMLHEHANAFERETAALRQEMQPIFGGTALPSTEDISIQSDSELARVVERVHRLALAGNDAVRSAFTISSQSSATAIRSATFWQSMQRAESLAKGIERYQAASK